MKDFIISALPWIIMGFCVAMLAVNYNKRKKESNNIKNSKNIANCENHENQELPNQNSEKTKDGDYQAEGMLLGICIGIFFGSALNWDMGLCISMGMLIGITGGMAVKKDQKNKKEKE